MGYNRNIYLLHKENKNSQKLIKLGDDIWWVLNKGATFIVVVFLAIVGKIGMDLMNRKTLSAVYVLGFIGVALFVAVMSYLICQYKNYNPVLSAIIVGASTMFSRDIMVLSLMLNWRKISSLNWADIIEILITKKKK